MAMAPPPPPFLTGPRTWGESCYMLAMYNLFNGCTRPGGGARPKACTLGLNSDLVNGLTAPHGRVVATGGD
jgi:hypothetical protein